jgi:hypothetical protein
MAKKPSKTSFVLIFSCFEKNHQNAKTFQKKKHWVQLSICQFQPLTFQNTFSHKLKNMTLAKMTKLIKTRSPYISKLSL